MHRMGIETRTLGQEPKNEFEQAQEGLILDFDALQIATLLEEQYLDKPIFTKNTQYCLAVQKGLSLLGYSIQCTGKYDAQTRATVVDFEKTFDLSIDNGVAGPEVIGMMIDLLNNPSNAIEIPRIKNQELKESSLDDLLPQSVYIESIFQQYLSKYTTIKYDFMKVAQKFALSNHEIKLLSQIIYKENPNFSTKRRNYTPVGQVGKLARIDGYKELGITPPERNKTNREQQITACYGYAKKCGIFNNPSGDNYTKYNLGLYYGTQSFTKTLKAFHGQASEMVKFANNHAKSKGRSSITLEDIHAAEYNYYTRVG